MITLQQPGISLASQQKVLINVDSSQAEARVVARLCKAITGTSRLDDIFVSGRSIHKVVGSIIYKRPETQIPKDNRPGAMYYVSKRTVHACNYDMGIEKYAIVTGTSIPIAKGNYNTFHRGFPEIKGTFHKWVQTEIQKERSITNAYGRIHVFLDRFGQDLYRKAYSYFPQSSVADLITLAFIDLYNQKNSDWQLDLLLTVHDSIVAQCLAVPEHVWGAIQLIQALMERPMNVLGLDLTIPSEASIGRSWKSMHAVKTLDDVKRILRRLRYRNETPQRLDQSVHGIHSGPGIPRSVPFLDSNVIASGDDEEERVVG
jgi:DNA polymerase I-like protein with 3'-5' exonuclease and polymerase domains